MHQTRGPNQRDLPLGTTNEIDLSEIHCCGCGRFLGLSAIAVGIIQIKCPKCKKWTTVSSWPDRLDNGESAHYNGFDRPTRS